MGFGNGAFQAARIAIDGVTIIENILTGKIQAPGTAIPSATNSYLTIPITNTQNVATPAPFQQMIQLNLSQYPQISGIASDLSNVYFSSDEAGQNKLYSWRETPASLTSDVTWWVLLPDGIPAGGTVVIYLQISSSTALDGVYTGEAPQLSSTYAEYDNGANVFSFYDNFAGTTLSSAWTVSGITYTVNNGFSATSSATNNGGIWTSSTTYSPPIILDFYGDPYSSSVSTETGFVTNTTSNNNGTFIICYDGSIFGEQQYSSSSLSITGNLATSNIGNQIWTIIWTGLATSKYQLNYENTQSVGANNLPAPLYIGLVKASSGTFSPTYYIQWIRIRAYPPNGVMPVLQAQTVHAVEAVLTATQNTWTMPQTFSAGLVDVNPTYAYVAYSSNVSIINTTTNMVIDTITIDKYTNAIAITPNGLYAYVAISIGKVSVINTTTNTVVDTITVGANPYSIAITPNGRYAYVANEGSNNVSVIDTATNTVVDTITVGSHPYSIAITPNGLYAYVANFSSNNVSVIDIATNTVVDTISTGGYPDSIAITPNGRYAYMASYLSTDVLVIDTTINGGVALISVGNNPNAIAITPNGRYAYVANYNSNNVSVIDTATNTVVDTITVGTSPVAVAVTPNGLYAYVANEGSNTISVINTTTNKVVDTITVGTSPFYIAITPYFYTATQIAPYLSGFQQNTATPQTTLAGSTAGSITYSMPTAEGAYKKFVAYASGYENDTTTAQTISFPVAFTNTPYIVTAPSGLISSTTTTSITLASGTTTTYTGWVIIEGY